MVDNYLIKSETINTIMIIEQLNATKERVHFVSVPSAALHHHILSQILMSCQFAVGGFRLSFSKIPC